METKEDVPEKLQKTGKENPNQQKECRSCTPAQSAKKQKELEKRSEQEE